MVNVCRVEKRHPLTRLDERFELEANGHPGDWSEVRAVIAALPERQRLVLFLRHYADLDYETIAQATGIERGTVAATLHAAHRKVRDAMTEVHSVNDHDVTAVLERLIEPLNDEVGSWDDVLRRAAGLVPRIAMSIRPAGGAEIRVRPSPRVLGRPLATSSRRT